MSGPDTRLPSSTEEIFEAGPAGPGLMPRLFAPDVDAFLRWRPPPVEPMTVD